MKKIASQQAVSVIENLKKDSTYELEKNTDGYTLIIDEVDVAPSTSKLTRYVIDEDTYKYLNNLTIQTLATKIQ